MPRTKRANFRPGIDSTGLATHRAITTWSAITELICLFDLDFARFGERWQLDTRNYFKAELERLLPMQEDGLLTLDDKGIHVTDAGRLLIRNICMEFDVYLKQAQTRFSRVI